MLESAKCRQTLTLVHILVGSTVLNTDSSYLRLHLSSPNPTEMYLGWVVDISNVVAIQKGVPEHAEKHAAYQIARVVNLPLQKK